MNGAISTFVNNFQQALNPQLVQSEAGKDRKRQIDLIYKSSKFSYFIMLLLSFPIVANLDYILSLWLGKYPAHTAEICALIIVGVLVSCLSGPLWVSIYATGKIKNYQIAVSSVALTVVPIVYLGGKFGMSPEIMFVVRSLNYVAVLIVQLFFLRNYITLNIGAFIKNVIVPSVLVTVGCIVAYFIFHYFMGDSANFFSLLYQSALYFIIGMVLTWLIGFNKSERNSISLMFKKVIR